MSSLSAIGPASRLQMDYVKLLVAQLQYQNPLEPLNNNEMASQLAQFSQLQQLESMNSNFAKVLSAVEHSYANSLIGKQVLFIQETETGSDMRSGVVEQVCNGPHGDIRLIVGDYNIGLEEVLSVKN